MTEFEKVWNELTDEINKNARAKGFWEDEDWVKELPLSLLERDPLLRAFKSQKLKLMDDEISEAHEAVRSNNPPSVKAEGFNQLEEELADVVIRIMDFGRYHDLDIAGAILKKHQYNLSRPYKHGRKF